MNAKIWKSIERASTIAVLLGIPFFFIERYFQIERDKTAATLDFVKKYQDAQLVAQRFVLLAPWLQYDLRLLKEANPSGKAIEQLVMRMISVSTEGGNKSDMRPAIFDVVDFFEALKLCVDTNKCDKKIAVAYFDEYAHQFYCLYRPFIVQLREQQSMPQYAKRLQEFALAKGPCP